ncbi:MAG: hypothetical protein ACPIOQ_56065 [Promethearchaeia archaeon]
MNADSRFFRGSKDADEPGPGKYVGQYNTNRRGVGSWDTPSVRPWSARAFRSARVDRLDLLGPTTSTPASNVYDVIGATSDFRVAESLPRAQKKARPTSAFGSSQSRFPKRALSEAHDTGPGQYQVGESIPV